MSLAAVRAALHSEMRNVLVEAPAGCGKTYEAAELATTIGSQLNSGREVLLLAHTNAAVQEFARRTRHAAARVRATTIDAFCVDLLAPYAAAIGLPTPFRRSVGLGTGRIPFSELAPKTVELLTRCPTISKLLAYRYPFIILDEHQDASANQHAVVATIQRSGRCLVRVFCDRMQAIYESGTGHAITWDHLLAESDEVVVLETPQRWRDEPELGVWIQRARTELKAGNPLPISEAPRSVRVSSLAGVQCAGFGRGNAGALAGPLQRALRNCTGSAAVLSRHNNHVWSLHVAAGGRLKLNEGAEFQDAYTLLEDVVAADGNPSGMATCLVDHLASVSSGLDQAKRSTIASALMPDRIEYGRNRILLGFLQQLGQLYERPDLWGFCEVVRQIVNAPPEWMTIRMPMSMRLLAQIRPVAGDNSAECLDEVIARLKAVAPRLQRSASTVHKAKGLEFDHVFVGNFSAAHFGNDELSRRIAYVALSRARKSLTFLVPANNPSPLLG